MIIANHKPQTVNLKPEAQNPYQVSQHTSVLRILQIQQIKLKQKSSEIKTADAPQHNLAKGSHLNRTHRVEHVVVSAVEIEGTHRKHNWLTSRHSIQHIEI